MTEVRQPRSTRAIVAFIASALALVMLVASASAATVLRRGNNSEPDSIDPHFAQGTWENNIIGDMIIGLYTEDAQGKAIYGAAESHTVSPDGLVWTFTLRDHVWSDGTPVTADDFVYAWRRILSEKGAQYASLLTNEFKNAKAINTGEAQPETLGARAIDAKTLELTLEHPAPYLPQLMTHYTTFPVPKHVVEKLGREWVKKGNYVGNGPYTLVEWRPNEYVKLTKNPRFWDAANVQVDEVYYEPTFDTSAALRRFRTGELDLQDGISSQDVDWIKANMRDSLHLQPYLGISYIAVNQTKPPLNDKRLREALSLAFDRDTIAYKVLKFEETPQYSLVPPGVAGYPGGSAFYFKDMPFDQRLAKAKELVQQAGYGPEKRLTLSFVTGNAPDNKRVSAAIQQMWKEIFIDIEISQQESKTVYALLRATDFQLAQAAWVADFDDAKNFLYLFRTDADEMNYGKYSNPEFDRLMVQSDQIADEVERGKILAAAEKIVLDDIGFISNRYLNTRHIVQPWVKGFVANLRDINRTRWLSVDRSGTQQSAPSAEVSPSDTTVAQEQSWGDWFASILCSWFGISCPAGGG
jgi:oligopeptide transport system substrate-binding protein